MREESRVANDRGIGFKRGIEMGSRSHVLTGRPKLVEYAG